LGWYLNFEVAGVWHCFVIGHCPTGETEAGTWIGSLERKRGLIGSLLGERKRGIQASAAHAIHQVLTESSAVRDVRWHFQRDFSRGIEQGAASPETQTGNRSSPQASQRNTEGL